MKYQSNILSDARGKLNGMVFTRGRYGAVIRNKVSPVQPGTGAQQLVKQNFGALSASWRDLTQGERNGWNAAVENWPRNNIFGQQYLQSGLNLYVGLNQNLLTAEQATIVEAPTPAEMPIIETGALIASAGGGTITLNITFNSTAAVPAGYRLVVASTPNISAGRTFVKTLYRVIGTYASATVTTALPLETVFFNKYGSLIEGQKVFVQVYLIDVVTGQASIPVQQFAIVGA